MSKDSIEADVDVVVPCYNYAHYLDFCVSTALEQSDVRVRILIVDDASKDATPEKARAIAVRDPRVSYVRNEKNLGLVGTINRGVMGWASAPFTLVLSADDALTPGALRRALQVMRDQPTVGMTYGLARVMGKDGPLAPVEDIERFEYSVVPGHSFIRDFCERKNGVASPTALVRTQTQFLVGGYEPRFPHTCDVEMWMRIATRADIAAIAHPQAYYRWHRANMSAAYIRGPINDLPQQIETCRWIEREWANEIPEMKSWVDAMQLRFADEACWLAGRAVLMGDGEAASLCLKFAAENCPALRRRKPYWSYWLKRIACRMVPRSALAKVIPANMPYEPFEEGKDFGRIPTTEKMIWSTALT